MIFWGESLVDVEYRRGSGFNWYLTTDYHASDNIFFSEGGHIYSTPGQHIIKHIEILSLSDVTMSASITHSENSRKFLKFKAERYTI